MMLKKHQLALHIFRRDLRLEDNTALLSALENADQVIPIFIYDPRQVGEQAYKSNNCIQFMIHSLNELNDALNEKGSKLYFFHGIAEDVIHALLTKLNINAVYVNRDYTPFSINRDKKIHTICQSLDVNFESFADALLQEPEQVVKKDGKPYTIYTHAYRCSSQLRVTTPIKNRFSNYYKKSIAGAERVDIKKILAAENKHLAVKGGRIEAKKLLKKVLSANNYDTNRNFPALDASSHLSAHNKFGTISIREFYFAIQNAFDSQHTLIKELYWRDFFTHIAYHFPKVFGSAFHQKYQSIKWENNKAFFQAWCEGRTGFPIVDAGMRELNTTGYMHNRVRMITASFLCKDLLIDWRWGERYFAQHLVDYDPAVNNGNWQWAASTGCDAQPFFRIFNPWLQQKKFDPNCLYIKKWLPELSNLTPKIIHSLEETSINTKNKYTKPIIEHKSRSKKAKDLYKYASLK